METFLPIMFWIIGALSPMTPVDEAVYNVEKYYEAVALVESDNKRYAVNYKTTATSYFQITKGAFKTAKARSKRHGYVITEQYVSALDYNQQRNLLFLDMYERKGSNKYVRAIIKGDMEKALEAYYTIHHTRPDPATLKRAQRIFKETYRNVR